MFGELLIHLTVNDKRPATIRMRLLLQSIETAVKAGHSHEDIHKFLVENGMAMNFQSYRRILARLRNEMREGLEKRGYVDPALPNTSQIRPVSQAISPHPSYNGLHMVTSSGQQSCDYPGSPTVSAADLFPNTGRSDPL
jgi:hypothetical protein